MFFGNALPDSHFAWRSTHPPLDERIRRLDPAWDGTYPKLAADEAPAKKPKRGWRGGASPRGRRASHRADHDGRALAEERRDGGHGPRRHRRSGAADGRRSSSRSPRRCRRNRSPPRPGSRGPRTSRRRPGCSPRCPTGLAARAREPMTARAVVLALLCDRDAAVRSRQLERVAASGDDALARELAATLPDADALPSESRLPLVDLAVPALRKLSRPQYTTFRALMDELVRADERLSLFEWTLHRVLLRHLDPWFVPKKPPRVTTYALRQLGAPLSQLLSTLAHAGSDDPAAAQTAFAAGVTALGDQAPPDLALLPRDATAPSAASTARSTPSPPSRRRASATSSPPAAPRSPATASSPAPKASCCAPSPTPSAARCHRCWHAPSRPFATRRARTMLAALATADGPSCGPADARHLRKEIPSCERRGGWGRGSGCCCCSSSGCWPSPASSRSSVGGRRRSST